jgi:hypothetical protein
MFSRLLLAMALVGVANAQTDCSDTEKIAAVCDCASSGSGAGDGTVGSYCISNTVYTLCVLNDVLGEACACPSSDESTASASGFVANEKHVCKKGADASTVGIFVACVGSKGCTGTDVCSTGAGTAPNNVCQSIGSDDATCAAISDAAAHWDATTSACVAQQACSADSSNGVCTGGTVKDANGTCATGTCGAADFGDDTKACCKTEFSPSSPASAPSSASAPSPSESEMDEETFDFLLSAGKMAGTNVFHAALTLVVAVWAVAC